MASKYCTFLLLLYLWQSAIASEYMYFCFVMKPRFKLEVTKSELSWGKWIAGFENYAYGSAPAPGDVIEADNERTICSSGRQSSASGTTGIVEFKDEHNRRITVKWNNPWGSSTPYANIEFDNNIFSYTESIINGQWYVQYDIDYVWPNTPQMNDKINYKIPWSCFYYDSCLRNSCDKNSCRARRDVSRRSDNNADDDSFCDSSDEEMDADCNDHLVSSNIYRGVTNADPGTVDNDVRYFEQLYQPVFVPYNASHPTPIRRYSTVYFPALNLRLPVVVRARINYKTVKAAGKRNSGGIQKAAKELTTALKRVKNHDRLSYHVGHMIAWTLGGPDAAYNFAPQTEFLNLRPYKKMESNIKNFVKSNPDGWVDMTVVVYYWRNTFMPVAFGVNLVYYFTRGVLASNCRDTLFWNQRPYPPNPPAIG